MKMDDDTWYQCKQCQDKFKTTAELQKHKRINHRPVLVVAKKSAPPPPPLSEKEDSDSEYINEGTEKLACGSCRHQFDTSDPVVLHLLRQYRNENGAFKCPYCVKVQLKKSDFLESPTELRKSPVRNLSMRRRSRSTGSNGRTSSRQLQNKRRVRKPLVESTVSASPVSLDTLSTPVTFKTSSSSSSSFRKSKYNRSFGVAYRHSEETRSSGNGISSTRTVGGHKRSSEVLRTKRYSDVETPLKLSVLINEEPLTNDRLAVPRAREYDKGNITCQYCGFIAKSFREVQFHINTHMAKSYPCEFCAAIYRSKQAVVKHTANHHADEAKAKQLLKEANPDFADGNSTESEKVYQNGDSSSMTSGEEYDHLFDSNMDSSVTMNDQTRSSFTTASSHFQPQEEENAGTGYGFQDKYFSTDSAQYSNSQPSEFEMVDTNLEKVVELANF